ncbi:MAG: class I SAM-dependent methyltransferase [bacterium]
MVYSKAWNWDIINDKRWMNPADELYPVAIRWKEDGIKRVLDLGCGIGRNSIFLSQMGFEVYACDLSESGIDRLNRTIKERGLSIVTTIADMHSLPYESKYFDALLAFYVIYHTDKEGIKEVISEIYRVLKDGGEAFLTFNSKKGASFNNPVNQRIDENTIIRMDSEVEKGIPHYYVDEEEVRRLLHGFQFLRFFYLEEIRDNNLRSSRYFVLARKV